MLPGINSLHEKLFKDFGAHVMVDGQYGSTGKGALAAWLGRQAVIQNKRFVGAITSAGPNSGHTFYDEDGNKHVLKQLPTFAVVASSYGMKIGAFLSGGAVIDLDILREEADRYPDLSIYVHGCAAVIKPEDKERERSGSIAKIASTLSGTGAALMRKINREHDAVWSHYWNNKVSMPPNVSTYWHLFSTRENPYFIEVSQGYSLGINSFFYPHTTSRECTAMQGLADARIPASSLKRTFMTIRTYPIRVGNLEGHSSGGWYNDQYETSWEEIGVTPELTTVTKRVRRVATFSDGQFVEACLVNDPDFVFVNFLNYMEPSDRSEFIRNLYEIRRDCGFRYHLIGGIGPKMEDINFV